MEINTEFSRNRYHHNREIVNALLNHKKFRIMDFFDNYEDASKFLYNNILFIYHPESDNIALYSERYIREMMSMLNV
jgi:hypothetical protein